MNEVTHSLLRCKVLCKTITQISLYAGTATQLVKQVANSILVCIIAYLVESLSIVQQYLCIANEYPVTAGITRMSSSIEDVFWYILAHIITCLGSVGVTISVICAALCHVKVLCSPMHAIV